MKLIGLSRQAPAPTSNIDLTDLGILALMTAAAVIALFIAPSIGSVGYVLPLSLAIGAATILFLVTSSRSAVVVLTFFAACVLSLSFRERAVGDTGLDWQNGLKVLAWIIMVCVGARHLATAHRLLRDRAMVLLVIFCCFCVASSLWSPVPTYSLGCAIGCFAWLGLAVACVAKLDEPSLMRVLTWALFAECAIGLLVGIFMPDSGAWLPEEGSDSLRLAGLSGHPNLLGQHSALFLIIIASRYQNGTLGKGWMLTLAACSILILVLTGSRTAMAAVMLAFLATYYRAHPRIALWSLLIGVTAFASFLLISASGLMPDMNGVMRAISRSGDAAEITTATNRSELWAIAWGHFLERPLLGWGFNGTEQLMADSVDADFEGNAVNAHNLVLQSLMSLGLMGSAPFFGLFAITISRFFRAPDPFRDRLLVFLLVLGFGEAELLSIPVLMLFLIFWCITRDAAKATSDDPHRHVTARRSSDLLPGFG